MYIICKEALSDLPSCKPALDTLAQYYYHLAAAAMETHGHEQARTAAAHAIKVLDAAAIADPMRINYWRYRKVQLQQLLVGLGDATVGVE